MPSTAPFDGNVSEKCVDSNFTLLIRQQIGLSDQFDRSIYKLSPISASWIQLKFASGASNELLIFFIVFVAAWFYYITSHFLHQVI